MQDLEGLRALAQQVLLYFAGRGLGQRFENDVAGQLETGEAGAAPGDNLFRSQLFRTPLQRHESAGSLTPLFVRLRHDRRLEYVRMPVQHLLDLQGRYVFAPGYDDV